MKGDVILQIAVPTLPSVLTIIISPIAIPDSSKSSNNVAISVNPRECCLAFLISSIIMVSLPFTCFPIILFASAITAATVGTRWRRSDFVPLRTSPGLIPGSPVCHAAHYPWPCAER